MSSKSAVGVGSLEELMAIGSKVNPEDVAPIEELQGMGEESSLKDKNTDLLGSAEVSEEKENLGEKQIEPLPNKTSKTDYQGILKAIFGDNLKVTTSDGQGEDEEKSINDIEVDLPVFKDILDQIYASDKDTSEVISSKGLSDTAKRFIEIDRNGGDISELLNFQKEVLNPINSLDISTQEGQVAAIYMRQRASRVPDEDTQVLINSWYNEGILEDKAEQAKRELQKHADDQLKHKEEQTLKAKKEAEDNRREYKSNFKEELAVFELNENSKQKLVEFATKEVTPTGLKKIDLAYVEHKNDPKKSVKLALFLLDSEEYDKQISSEMVKKSKLASAVKIRVVKGNSGFKAASSKPQESEFGDLKDLDF